MDTTIKVTKKGTHYAVVKETVTNTLYVDEVWYVVDIASGTKIKKCYTASDAKWYLSNLESGYDTPETYKTSWNYEWGKPIDLPPSLQKMQQQLLNPTPSKTKAGKPIGTTVPSLVAAEDVGPYKVLELDDGTFGFYVPSSGASKLGYKTKGGASKGGAKEAANAAAKTLSDMGVDAGSDAVDTLLKVYEDRMRGMYGQAAADMTRKQAEYLSKFQQKNSEMLKAVSDGRMSNEQYRKWLAGQASTRQWLGEMVDGLSQDLVDADKNAMRMLNGYTLRAYGENFNFATFQIEGQASIDTGFALYNESTVARLVSNPEGSLLPDLPQAKIDELKDAVWSKQKITACVSQSILQGESVPEAAKRLRAVVGMSANAAMRTARTTLTAAQNLGRLDAGRRAKAMGIRLKKQWIATVDARTRYSHREIDRETVELEEDFSNGCDCPAHLNTGRDPSEVYNCRCAMRYVLPDHEYDDLPDYTREGVAYDDWKNERLTKLAAQKDKIQAQLDDANAHIADLKKLLPDDEDFASKFHTSIISGSSKVSDWSEDAVRKSEDYYFQKLQQAIASNNQFDIDWYKKRLAQLKEYDDAGRAYHAALKTIEPQLKRWQDVADDAKGKLKKINAKGGGKTFTAQALDSAYKFVNDPRNGIDGMRECDRLLRPYVGEAWKNATQAQRRAAYTYTGSPYVHYNRPLNGFNRNYWSFVGYGAVDIDNEGYGSEVRELTTFLQHCENPADRWVRRGTNTGEMDTFFGFPAQNRFENMTDEELQGLVGHSARIGSFLSTGNCIGDSSQPSDSSSGVYKGSTGFSGTVDLQIFVPEGAQVAYAVPFSACDSGSGLSWDGVSGQSSFGTENETILQRGGSYTCIGIERHGWRYLVQLELHPEDGYDLFQQ